MRYGLVMFWLASTLLGADASELSQAENLYRHTEYSAAIQLISAMPTRDAAANELLGKCYFGAGDYKKATEPLERAAADDPSNSNYHLWLGRVYGKRAETSFALNAMNWAPKARTSLEKAIQLDPHNAEAANDLFEYYLEAPGFMGGGLDKAEKLAESIAQRDPAEGSYARARIAEARKQFASAEQQLRRAAELAPRQVGRLLDLAKFLAKQGRYDESDRTFVQADRLAPDAPKVMFAKAATYIKTGRNVDSAKDLLKKYLTSSITPDDPPKSEAEKLLRKASGS